jgi:hypothetical protein
MQRWDATTTTLALGSDRILRVQKQESPVNRSKKMTFALIAGLLVLYSISAFAAPKPKATLCHVGHEEGPNGETYNSNCVPGENNDYFLRRRGQD